MDKAITTAFMVIVSVVVSVMIYNTVYPAVVQSSNSVINMRTRMDDRLRSQIEIIHATAELDQDGVWQDTNGDGRFNGFVWLKNIGSSRISAVGQTDLFFGPEGNFARIPHEEHAGGAYPYWTWDVENDESWDPTTTVKVTIHYSSPLSTGRYFVKAVLANGLSFEYFFSL